MRCPRVCLYEAGQVYDEFEEVVDPVLGACVVAKSILKISCDVEAKMVCGYNDPENFQMEEVFINVWNYYNRIEVKRDYFQIQEDWYYEQTLS